MKEKIKAYLGSDPYIFVSYAHKDFETISPFIVALQEHYNVWFDEGLTPGERYNDEIIAKIEACSVFLYLITEESLTSEYCKKEVKFANKKKKPFINVLVKEVRLPSWFEFEDLDSYQYLSLFKFDSPEEAIADLIQKSDALKKTEKASTSKNLYFRPYDFHDGVCEVAGVIVFTDTSIAIPSTSPAGDRVISIGEKAFSGCANLTSITIPDGIEYICERAFQGCLKLTSITIPSSVKKIESGAFSLCPNLEFIQSKSFHYSVLNNCLIDSFTGVLLAKGKDALIPEGVTIIGEGVFSGCIDLTSISIPEGVKSIEKEAFSYCSALTKIELPSSVINIGDEAFSACTALQNIIIPNGVTNIGNEAFCGCNSLTSVIVPGSVTKLGNNAFWICNNLSSIILSDGIKCIGNETFRGCEKLTSVTIPESVTDIGNFAFAGCKSLISINIPANIVNIGVNPFCYCSNLELIASNSQKYPVINNCLIDITTKLIVSGQKSGTIPTNGSITGIRASAFAGCESLSSIIIPTNVSQLGGYAFENCYTLTSIIFENGNRLTRIGSCAFLNCEQLTTIEIPSGIRDIEDETFKNCKKLTSISIPDNVISIGENAFCNCISLTRVIYSGTISQWNSITKGNNWEANTGTYTIHCTDGDIAKE